MPIPSVRVEILGGPVICLSGPQAKSIIELAKYEAGEFDETDPSLIITYKTLNRLDHGAGDDNTPPTREGV